MKNIYLLAGLLLAIITFLVGMQVGKRRTVLPGTAELSFAMNKLWEDHIVWTRNYIISELGNLEDLDTVVNRLLANQVDIGKAIQPFYGVQAADALMTLLKEHILIASRVVKAAKVNDQKELEIASKQWYKNADEIAAFLSKANPHWAEKVIKDMLYKHLEYTTGETVARLNKKWQEDIDFYDKNHTHMLMFSEQLVQGLAAQFPEKF